MVIILTPCRYVWKWFEKHDLTMVYALKVHKIKITLSDVNKAWL